MGDKEEARFLPHHIRIMKVALAMAVIRRKPAGLSAREFTERLALQFSQLQTDWRRRSLQLEQELLRTRQELVKYQIHEEKQFGYLPPLPPNGLTQLVSESHSSGYSSLSLTGCTSHDHQPSVNGHRSLNDQYRNSPLDGGQGGWMGSGESCTGSVREEQSLEERIRLHVVFLTNVSSLLNAQHPLSAVNTSDLRLTVRDTLLDAMKGVSEGLRSEKLIRLPLAQSTMEKAARTLIDAIELPLLQPFQEELCQSCSELLRAAISRLVWLRGVHETRQTDHPCLQSLVLILSSSPRLLPVAVGALAREVARCAAMLVASREDLSLLDPDIAENTAVVVRTLELIFTTHGVSSLPKEVCLKIKGELELSLLDIADCFPLFTYGVWRLTAYLTRRTSGPS